MKNKRLIGSLIGLVFILMFLGTISNSRNLNLNNTPIISQGEIEPDKLIPVDFPIYIDNNWSYYIEKYDWCSGKGIKEDPYIIEGIHVTNEEQTAYISIQNVEHFIIRNVIVSNYSAPYGHHIFAGIYIGNGAFGLIENCTIINCTTGISLANGRNYELSEITNTIKITNCNFIGSHDDADTGLGGAITIQGTHFGYGIDPDVEITTYAKNINISYNDIYNYYSGVIVSCGEKIYVEDNRIEASFDHISDTGVYFKEVNDSTIKNNDFYKCEPTTQDSTEISISSFDDNSVILLEDCYNIEIYGNNYFDIPENLIIPDDPDDPNNPDNMIPYWIFIILGVICICIMIIIYLKRK